MSNSGGFGLGGPTWYKVLILSLFYIRYIPECIVKKVRNIHEDIRT
jgi:hypothetical protein